MSRLGCIPYLLALAVVAGGAVVLGAPAVTAGSRGTSALHLEHVARLDAPVYATAPKGEDGKLYVVEQAGRIMVVDTTNGQIRPTPFLDIRPLVRSGGEQGLLSVAFDPAYATNHRFYVDYTDLNGDTHVVRYLSNGQTASMSSARQLLFVKDFAPNHNGGQLQFGPDGRLYWGNGDGGGGGDPQLNGQNLNRPFAKIMRLNVDAAKPRWQLVAFGLRNPWRFSFDRLNGDLYIGDVGQDSFEEVDYLKHGWKGYVNFGWSRFEGLHTYDASRALLPTGRYVKPIVEYPHNPSCSVTGGYVYRGKKVGAAVGRYFYGDYCSGRIWSLRVASGRATGGRLEPFNLRGLSSFGEDDAGEQYLMSVDTGDLYRLAG